MGGLHVRGVLSAIINYELCSQVSIITKGLGTA